MQKIYPKTTAAHPFNVLGHTQNSFLLDTWDLRVVEQNTKYEDIEILIHWDFVCLFPRKPWSSGWKIKTNRQTKQEGPQWSYDTLAFQFVFRRHPWYLWYLILFLCHLWIPGFSHESLHCSSSSDKQQFCHQIF